MYVIPTELLVTLNTFLTKQNLLSYLPRVEYFGLAFSVTWPGYRHVNDGESSLGVGLRGMYVSSVWYRSQRDVRLFCMVSVSEGCTSLLYGIGLRGMYVSSVWYRSQRDVRLFCMVSVSEGCTSLL